MCAGTDLSPILPVLAKVFDQALEGGGAKNINFQELAADLAQITFDYPFRIPPYFALIIRAISVLEGIALTGDPDFALVDEAYPYIAKRLLTDRSPRLQAALRYMVSPARQPDDVWAGPRCSKRALTIIHDAMAHLPMRAAFSWSSAAACCLIMPRSVPQPDQQSAEVAPLSSTPDAVPTPCACLLKACAC